jgi:tetratricopeptide (TPR) repeat protein
MFDDKIKKWGLGKNASRSKRKATIEELHDGDGDGKDVKKTPLKLTPGKIERWEREDKLSGSFGKPAVEKGKAAAVSTSRPTDQRPPDRALSPLREIIEISAGSPEVGKQYRTIWDMADIPGSPNLSRFHSFLKIAEEFELPPPLRRPPRDPGFITSDEWSDVIKRPADDTAEMHDETLSAVVRLSRKRQRSPSPSKLLIYEWLLQQTEKPWTPLNEVSPFPISVKTRKTRSGIHVKVSPMKARELDLIESESRLRKMQRTLLPDNPGLVAEMDRLAFLYIDTGKYALAESLYQRVAMAHQDAFGHCDRRTLAAYLDVIWAKTQHGENDKVISLHQDLNSKIQQLFNPCDDLALRSRFLLADILRVVDRIKEAEKVQREMLQIVLGEFGQRDARTLSAMSSLGHSMRVRNQHAQSEQLQSVVLQILIQDCQDSESFEADVYKTKVYLGVVLEMQGRHAESCRLLKDALSWSTFTWGMEHPLTLEVIANLSISLKQTGQLEDSELLLGRNLRRYEQILGPKHRNTCLSILDFATVLTELGCWVEAADLFEHLYRRYWETWGPHHEYTGWAREKLDKCYEMQGLYDDREAFEEKLENILESKADFSNVFTQRRKYGRISGARDDEFDEVEEIRPEKKRRTMTCTFNLKAAQV